MAELEQKRISQLTQLSSAEVTKLITSRTEAEKWHIVADYRKPSGSSDTDKGSKNIPVNRIGLLSATTRMVPASMLPSYISHMYTGRMTVNNGKWTFVYEDEEQVSHTCVCPGPAGAGEEMPKIDYVYANQVGDDFQQYRYVPSSGYGTAQETGKFVPIPSDLMVIDGRGVKVTDNYGAKTRRFDVNIGTNPASKASGNANPLQIVTQDSKDKLVHCDSGVTAGTYPNGQTANPGFGGTFKVPAVTVDATGHVTGVSDTSITVPSTEARAAVAGLVKVGTTSTAIAAQPDPGTVAPSGGYVLVAAADHRHNAYTLSLKNNGTVTDVKYDGSADVEYDMRNVLQAALPTVQPTAGQILVSEAGSGTGLGAWKAVWKDSTAVVNPEYVFFSVGGTVGGNLTVSNKTSLVLDATASTTSIGLSGLRSGKTYVVSYGLALQAGSAGSSLVTYTLSAGGASATHVLDESVTGIPNYVNGTLMFTASASTATLTGSRDGSATWTYASGSTIQVAEVK
jgi:hypothetical protein